MESFSKSELNIIDRYFGLEKYHLVIQYPDTEVIHEKLFESENCPFCGSYFKGNVMLCEECETLFCDMCDDERNTKLDGKFCPDFVEKKNLQENF